MELMLGQGIPRTVRAAAPARCGGCPAVCLFASFMVGLGFASFVSAQTFMPAPEQRYGQTESAPPKSPIPDPQQGLGQQNGTIGLGVLGVADEDGPAPVSAGMPFPIYAPLGKETAPVGNLTERLLLPLLEKEQQLLEKFGVDHPEVKANRARQAAVRQYIAEQPLPAPRPQAKAEPDTEPPLANSHFPHADSPSAKAAPLAEPKAKEPPPVLPAAAGRAADPQSQTAPQPGSSLTSVLLQLITILAALVVILLVQLVALLVILRRYAAKLTPQLRVELVNGVSGHKSEAAPGEVLAQRIYLESPEPALRRRPAAVEEMPSYRDELHAGKEAGPQREDAVLRQIFEDNLRLREQLGELAGAA